VQPVYVVAYSVLALAALVALTNWLTDPAGIYRPAKSKQTRNLRQRRLSLLKAQARKPCATLVLGSSRVYNLQLAGDSRFPQPTLSFAVTVAKAEDYLACFRLVREARMGDGTGASPVGQDTQAMAPVLPVQMVIIGIEHPAFHPSMPPHWEAYTAGRDSDAL
jgi:hypothetical protein